MVMLLVWFSIVKVFTLLLLARRPQRSGHSSLRSRTHASVMCLNSTGGPPVPVGGWWGACGARVRRLKLNDGGVVLDAARARILRRAMLCV